MILSLRNNSFTFERVKLLYVLLLMVVVFDKNIKKYVILV